MNLADKSPLLVSIGKETKPKPERGHYRSESDLRLLPTMPEKAGPSASEANLVAGTPRKREKHSSQLITFNSKR